MSQTILARFGFVAAAILAGSGCGSETPVVQKTAPTTSAAPTSALRIMPLGDSITQADSEHDSYRRPLWRSLEASGHSIDFVGTQTSNHRGGPPHRDFDLDHEGHWGWRVDEILESFPGWVETHRPDAILVHLGSNDLFQRQSVESTVEELSRLVDIASASEPSPVIFLAQIIPTTTESANRRIRELNAQIARLASHPSVRIVDHYTGFDGARLTYDGVHPN
ncbi:MAG TPA: SGNH/GDSL hydrolase family protein, partial [Vicinamibacteria bacterium]|nr:SGNH/GDSL hydrolase family protein [Vicinamibacteria bacterium]